MGRSKMKKTATKTTVANGRKRDKAQPSLSDFSIVFLQACAASFVLTCTHVAYAVAFVNGMNLSELNWLTLGSVQHNANWKWENNFRYNSDVYTRTDKWFKEAYKQVKSRSVVSKEGCEVGLLLQKLSASFMDDMSETALQAYFLHYRKMALVVANHVAANPAKYGDLKKLLDGDPLIVLAVFNSAIAQKDHIPALMQLDPSESDCLFHAYKKNDFKVKNQPLLDAVKAQMEEDEKLKEMLVGEADMNQLLLKLLELLKTSFDDNVSSKRQAAVAALSRMILPLQKEDKSCSNEESAPLLDTKALSALSTAAQGMNTKERQKSYDPAAQETTGLHMGLHFDISAFQMVVSTVIVVSDIDRKLDESASLKSEEMKETCLERLKITSPLDYFLEWDDIAKITQWVTGKHKRRRNQIYRSYVKLCKEYLGTESAPGIIGITQGSFQILKQKDLFA
ncbi:MAG: hypothetical protein SGILL_009883, partial [Bacillariaceae sp.]